MVAAPQRTGTFLDKKFREFLAKRAVASRYTLFHNGLVSSTGAFAQEEVYRKVFADPVFSAVGDTLHLDVFGIFAITANNKGVHISIEDEAGVPFQGYDSLVFNGAITHFHLNAQITLQHIASSNDKRLAANATMITNQPSTSGDFTNVRTSGGSAFAYTAKKCVVIIEATGGAANDVDIYSIRGEFSPGILG